MLTDAKELISFSLRHYAHIILVCAIAIMTPSMCRSSENSEMPVSEKSLIRAYERWESNVAEVRKLQTDAVLVRLVESFVYEDAAKEYLADMVDLRARVYNPFFGMEIKCGFWDAKTCFSGKYLKDVSIKVFEKSTVGCIRLLRLEEIDDIWMRYLVFIYENNEWQFLISKTDFTSWEDEHRLKARPDTCLDLMADEQPGNSPGREQGRRAQ